MTEYGGLVGGRKILFANMRIKQIIADTTEGTLCMRALYDEREYCNMRYDNVYYSQLDDKAVGRTIFLAEKLTFPEFRQSGSRDSMAVLVAECGAGNVEFLGELDRRGYNLFVHYLGKAAELLVIAKQMTIT